MINLEEKLKKNKNHFKNKEIKKSKNLIENVNTILEQSNEEDLKYMESKGYNINHVKDIKKDFNKKIKRNFNIKDTNKIYHSDEIKKLTKNYKLRFRPIREFVAPIDPALPSLLKTFEKENNFNIGKNDLYILAPKNNFKIQEPPKDPLCFVQIHRKYFYLVHKWGDDLSSWRRILGFITNTDTWYITSLALIALSILTGLTIHSNYLLGVFIGVISFIMTLNLDSFLNADKNDFFYF